jgi:hypothetical protein
LPGRGCGYPIVSSGSLRGMEMSLVEVVWDLIVFFAMVAVGLVVLRLLAGMR